MAVGSYLIYYEVLESARQVNILHFLHGARRSPFARISLPTMLMMGEFLPRGISLA
jgi:hypothetical protein